MLMPDATSQLLVLLAAWAVLWEIFEQWASSRRGR